jgi:DNA-binding transcriptional regulator YdaS (Cro superfamily)
MSTRRERHHAIPGSRDRLAVLNDTIARAGGIIKFSREMGVKPQAVTNWRMQRFVSLERAIQIEQLYGVPREKLITPDVAAAINTPRPQHVGLL